MHAAPPGLECDGAFCALVLNGLDRLLGAKAQIYLAAEAPLFHGVAGLAVCLKAYPDTNR
jgi:hypothetical protein